jgi:hypothetical protein
MPVVCALILAATATSIPFDRVDLLSEDPGTWIHYDVPGGSNYPTRPAMRFLTQIKPVFELPVEGLYLGASLSSQSLVYERPLLSEWNLYWSAGVQTRLLLPRGVMAGVAWRFWRLRVGLGLSAVSEARWSNPSWRSWAVLPTLGLGIGRMHGGPEVEGP